MEIEVDRALQRLGDNKALYVNLALIFPQDATGIAALLRQHLQAGELRGAADVLHKLKGVASTLGARALAEHAAELELQIKAGRVPADTQAINVAFETLIAETLAKLDQVVAALRPAPQDSLGAVSATEGLKAMLAELLPLLESANMRALSVFAKMQYKFGGSPSLQSSPRMSALADAMNRLDFGAALENGRLIAAQLEGSPMVSDDVR